ncbi:hypothetical protein L2E82_06638 [Cichorium intybus]|uniref:Uncharacterized protein n=1 Tax=Cichorium intybus TaxID=13427 RepID=A0ACB9HAH8_CICIN|nr:hypothetical protein L2E82_06638 [Cichorium intybus]
MSLLLSSSSPRLAFLITNSFHPDYEFFPPRSVFITFTGQLDNLNILFGILLINDCFFCLNRIDELLPVYVASSRFPLLPIAPMLLPVKHGHVADETVSKENVLSLISQNEPSVVPVAMPPFLDHVHRAFETLNVRSLMQVNTSWHSKKKMQFGRIMEFGLKSNEPGVVLVEYIMLFTSTKTLIFIQTLTC